MKTVQRNVVLAVDPAVMPVVEKALAAAKIQLGPLLGGRQRLRTYLATGRAAARVTHGDVRLVEQQLRIIERIGATRRQVQILELLAEGQTYAEIGERLGISASYASEQAQALFRRLDAKDRAHAVARGFRLGLLGNAVTRMESPAGVEEATRRSAS